MHRSRPHSAPGLGIQREASTWQCLVARRQLFEAMEASKRLTYLWPRKRPGSKKEAKELTALLEIPQTIYCHHCQHSTASWANTIPVAAASIKLPRMLSLHPDRLLLLFLVLTLDLTLLFSGLTKKRDACSWLSAPSRSFIFEAMSRNMKSQICNQQAKSALPA